MTEKRDDRWTTPKGHAKVLMYPALIAPKVAKDDKGMPTGKKAYSADFVFENDDPDLQDVLGKALAVFKEAFPKQYSMASANAKAGNNLTRIGIMRELGHILNIPFAFGDDRADKREKNGKDGSFWRGKVILRAASPELKRDGTPQNPPALGAILNGKYTNLDTPAKRSMAGHAFYSGVECFFEVAFSAYTVGKGGVKAYIRDVFSTCKGEQIGGADLSSKYGGDHIGHETNESVLDDEIPL